ncbi:MAG: Ig-like domain-containing protein [Cyclobacteriaceae bacterium]
MKMNLMKMKALRTGLVFLIGAVAMVACEQAEDDLLTDLTLEELSPQVVLSIPGQPTVLDLLEGVNVSTPIQFEVRQQPTQGQLNIIDKGLATYEAPRGNNRSIDRFTAEIRTTASTYQREFQVETVSRVGYPISEQGAVYDRGGILKPGESIVVDVLANDAEGATSLEVEVPPAQGTASVTDNNEIIYQANDTYTGLVDVIYKATFEEGRTGRAVTRFLIE